MRRGSLSAGPAEAAARVVVLDDGDSVAVAAGPLRAGAVVQAAGRDVTLVDDVPFGHKVALVPIAEGAQVLKYGEVIGVATQAIPAGSHVHVHNLVSARLP